MAYYRPAYLTTLGRPKPTTAGGISRYNSALQFLWEHNQSLGRMETELEWNDDGEMDITQDTFLVDFNTAAEIIDLPTDRRHVIEFVD